MRVDAASTLKTCSRQRFSHKSCLCTRSRSRLEELERIWVKAPFTLRVAQPLDKIRDYYGERIAIYYAFVEELTNALAYPAVVGVLLFIVSLVWFEGSNDNPFTPFYSFQILVWITYFCKMWRRTEAVHAVHWNVSDFRETERPRHEFDGDMERGFYSDDGYWVAVDDNEPHAEKVPLMKSFCTRSGGHARSRHTCS